MRNVLPDNKTTGSELPGTSPSFGVIITNRDRTRPLHACLGSLAAQHTPPAWVLLSDMGSQPPHRSALTALADRYQISYLRIDHDGVWNKGLAFNTAFRLALSRLPAVSHVVQLDADMISHPRLLSTAADRLREGYSCYCCVPRMAPAQLDHWQVPGDPAGYERMLAQCGPVFGSAVGVCMVFPCSWLAEQRGFDEAFTRWGHQDTEMWWRARNCLASTKDASGTLLIHQWHEPQPGRAASASANWPLLLDRLSNRQQPINPDGWGRGRIAVSLLRPGIARATTPEPTRPA